MSERFKQIFLQRSITDGQKVHAKTFNSTNYERSENQNYNEVSPHTGQNGHHQKICKQGMLERVWKKMQPFYIVGGNVSWYSHYGK